MQDPSTAVILVAEDNDVNREMMVRVLQTRRYRVLEARSGQEAIEALRKQDIDLVFMDLNMTPIGGFDVIRFMQAQNLAVPVVIVTGDTSGDILMQAQNLGVERVMTKPVDPARLLSLAERIIKGREAKSSPLGSVRRDGKYTQDELLQQLSDLAERNVLNKKGGPFAALVCDAEGRIWGEGVQGTASRADPIAHAEVMAIRQASDVLGRTDLSECVLYCTSEPTLIGRALVESVGITKVFFVLDQTETRSLYRRGGVDKTACDTDYRKLDTRQDSIRSIFKTWQAF